MSARPAVSVVVPFHGSDGELERVVRDLGALARREGDELIVADNSDRPPSLATPRAGDVRVIAAAAVRGPAFARNAGARLAHNEWLLFIDADTRPSRELLDAYFDPAPAPSTAVLAGAIADVAAGSTLVARYVAARERMSQRVTLSRRGSAYAQTGNCAIRRAAFEAVGGFDADIRAGEDADLCFRLARAGWGLEQRPAARVAHPSPRTLVRLLGQVARHGSGAAWLNRRYPGEFEAPSAREMLRRTPHYLRAAARARADRDEALFALVDLLALWAFDLGRLLPNRAQWGVHYRSRRRPSTKQNC